MTYYDTVKDLPRSARTVHRIFRKQELQQIAEELGIEVGRKNTRQLVLEAVNNLEEEGIPDASNVSVEMFEFLLNIDFIDEKGKIQDIIPEKIVIPEGTVSTKPECFSFADIRDPSCKRCIILDECLEQRVLTRPACFGKMFLETSEECRGCIDSGVCREVVDGSTT